MLTQSLLSVMVKPMVFAVWRTCRILLQENLSSGFPRKRVSNQSPQLQRLARKLKFHLKQVYIWYLFEKLRTQGFSRRGLYDMYKLCFKKNPRILDRSHESWHVRWCIVLRLKRYHFKDISIFIPSGHVVQLI